jgi:DNA repair exonuclease SbcCD ATPase subunit
VDLAVLETKYDSRLKVLEKKKTENEIFQKQIDDNLTQVNTLATQLGVGQEALQLLEDIANSRRGAMKEKIEQIVSEALKLIYGNDYAIELFYSVKNNRSFMDIELVKNTSNGQVKRNMDGFGGGVSDSISVPLRLLVLLGSKQTDRVCILDECYKHVDLERIQAVADFVKEISSKLGVQIIMCSHHEAMQEKADVVYEIKDKNGKAEVTRVTSIPIYGN